MKGETVTVGVVGGQKSEEKITKGAGDQFYKRLKNKFFEARLRASVPEITLRYLCTMCTIRTLRLSGGFGSMAQFNE